MKQQFASTPMLKTVNLTLASPEELRKHEECMLEGNGFGDCSLTNAQSTTAEHHSGMQAARGWKSSLEKT